MDGWLPAPTKEAPRRVGRPLLALSDIRGDLSALESVLSAVRRLELCGIVCAGEHCYGGPEPFAVWQRLMSLGATMVRGVTDLALGALRVEDLTPTSPQQEAEVELFRRTRAALGDVVSRRLAELPTTAVVSLDDRSGVMVLAGSPKDDHLTLGPDLDDDELEEETGCVAEDVLVVGRAAQGFVRRLPRLLVVQAGSVAKNAVRAPDGRRTAHAVLIQPYSDGVVRAFGRDIAIEEAEHPGLRASVG